MVPLTFLTNMSVPTLQHPAITAIAWSPALPAVVMPLAIRRYQRATAG